MAFVTKTWKDRLVEYAGRRKIKNVATGEETLVDVSRSEGTVSQAGDAFSAANMNNLEQRIKNEFDTVNSSLRPHIRLALPNVSANAASVGDYINQNYLHTYNSVTFDVVAENKDFFSGTLSTDRLANVTGRTVWGIIQQRSGSANNSTAYKYFASGIGGAGSVSPFSSMATLLWENSNISASMNAQTISGFGGENYEQLLIQTNHSTSNHNTSCWLWFPSKGISLYAGSENGVADNARTFTWNNDGSVSMNVDYFSGNYQPHYVIPVKIYGLKSKIKLQDKL